jgi:hypothetical protein
LLKARVCCSLTLLLNLNADFLRNPPLLQAYRKRLAILPRLRDAFAKRKVFPESLKKNDKILIFIDFLAPKVSATNRLK